MAGAALRGMGKVLRKHLKKSPILGKYARTGTAAGTIRLGQDVKGGKLTTKQSIKLKEAEARIDVRRSRASILMNLGSERKRTQELAKKLHKEKKEKLTKAVEEHKKKTKEQKEKVKG